MEGNRFRTATVIAEISTHAAAAASAAAASAAAAVAALAAAFNSAVVSHS